MKQKNDESIDDILGSEELKEESASKELLTIDTKNLPAKSELSEEQVTGVTKLMCLADWFDLSKARDFAQHFLKFQISKKRAGRKEFLDSLKANLDNEKNKNPLLGNLLR